LNYSNPFAAEVISQCALFEQKGRWPGGSVNKVNENALGSGDDTCVIDEQNASVCHVLALCLTMANCNLVGNVPSRF
jgi:hypothetical protein